MEKDNTFGMNPTKKRAAWEIRGRSAHLVQYLAEIRLQLDVKTIEIHVLPWPMLRV